MGQTKIFEVTQNVPTTQYRDENIFLCENILKYFFVESDMKKCYILHDILLNYPLLLTISFGPCAHNFQKCGKV